MRIFGLSNQHQAVPRVKRRAALTLALLLMANTMNVVQANDQAAGNAVKAAIIFKLAKFVTWPDVAFESQSDRITICYQEADTIGPKIEELADQRLHGRRLETRLTETVENPAATCQILIATHTSNFSVDQIQTITTAPVLTIGDRAAFGGNDGVITLTIEDDRVKFFINLAASEQANLNIGAQLLQLAQNSSAPGSQP